jgi:hypothetical protein
MGALEALMSMSPLLPDGDIGSYSEAWLGNCACQWRFETRESWVTG